jgi:hypothetical protein
MEAILDHVESRARTQPDAPPDFLMDSTTNPKVKIAEEK